MQTTDFVTILLIFVITLLGKVSTYNIAHCVDGLVFDRHKKKAIWC